MAVAIADETRPIQGIVVRSGFNDIKELLTSAVEALGVASVGLRSPRTSFALRTKMAADFRNLARGPVRLTMAHAAGAWQVGTLRNA